jgi:hypothetical protein
MRRIPVLLGVLLCSSVLAQSLTGSFRYVQKKDAISDTDSSYIYTNNIEKTNPGAQLQWRCQINSRTKKADLFVALEHQIDLPKYYKDYARVRWQYRFDKNKPSFEWLSYFSEDQSRIYITDEARQDFTDQAKRAQRLSIQITGDDLEPQVYAFSIQEFAQALAKLKCKIEKPER